MGCANSCLQERFLTLENFEDPRQFATGEQPAAAKQKKAHICEGNVNEKYKKVFRHQKIIKDLGAQGEKFTDEEFAPELSLLNKTGNAPQSFNNFVFKRATEFMDPKEIAVFRGIDPNDIRQGALGDCYLLCCLATLAERPKLVERLIITEDVNQVGCYAIWLCDAGTWRSVIVDDYFPYNPKTRLPAFTKSNGPELWVLLLEKAYAKLFGGYDVIEGGLPQYALKDLTGAPYESKESSDPDVMWDFIKKSDEKNYLLTCYSKSTEKREEKNPLGIVSGHAYSILNAKEILDENGSISDRIVQIRNPWGKFEWTGAWGDKSSKWTPEAKAQIEAKGDAKYVDADDGTFWMSINDFVTFYEGVGICKLHEDYFYQSVKLKHIESTLPNFRSKDDALIPYENPNRTVVRLRVEKKSHLFLSVNQTDDRKFLVSGLPYSYSNVRMFVSKVTPDGLRYEAGVSQADRDVVIEATLGKGDYLVSIEITWEQEHHKRFNFSAYSENPVKIERVGEPDYDLLERNVLKSFAVKNSASKLKDYGNIGEPNIKRYMGSAYDLVYFYYDNQSNTALKETVFMNGRSNLRACLPFTNNNQFEVTVAPRSDAIVVFKTVFLNEGFAFSLKSEFKTTHLGGLASMVKVPEYAKTLYYDNPEDFVTAHHDLDCYNEFIKDDKDVYVSVHEVRAEAPEAEEEDKEVVVQVLAQIRGQLIDEEGNSY